MPLLMLYTAIGVRWDGTETTPPMSSLPTKIWVCLVLGCGTCNKREMVCDDHYLRTALRTFLMAVAVSAASCSVRFGITRSVATLSAAHSAFGSGSYWALPL